MEVNKLMINDWVQDTNCTTPSKVAGLTQGKVYTWWADNTKHAKDEVYFEPVPLTAEILEKNGFMSSPFGWYLYDEDKDICYVEVIISKGRGKSIDQTGCVWLDYVHELQHALRLCGLNEMADNFKI